VSYIKRLKEKWNIQTGFQLVIVLIVFSCTGFTVLYLKKPYNAWLDDNGGSSTLTTIIYVICILPIYNVILLCYGFLFGQFAFFWNYEKKMWGRIFVKKPKKDEQAEQT